jgi:hypothetical protein
VNSTLAIGLWLPQTSRFPLRAPFFSPFFVRWPFWFRDEKTLKENFPKENTERKHPKENTERKFKKSFFLKGPLVLCSFYSSILSS